METVPKATLIGAPVRRVEDARLLLGRGRYVADLAVARMGHVAFLRSPHPHARIVNIDAAAARSMPGVMACVTAAELAPHARPVRAVSRMKGYVTTDFPPLAMAKVRFAGEAVVAVVADSRYTAEDALERIRIDYEPLPAVAAPRSAMEATSPRLHEEAGTNVLLTRAFAQGDAEVALRGAAVRIADRFRFRRHAGVAIGPYRVPHYQGEVWGVATNKAPMGPYRGVGRPVSTFVTEALLDRAARRLGLDPVALRLRNFIRPEDFPYRSPSGVVWDCGSFAESLEAACAAAGYAELRAMSHGATILLSQPAHDPTRASGTRHKGIGVASYVELTGVGSAIPASPGADISTGTEGATVQVDPTGTVTASFGLACHGQGHETALAQVLAAGAVREKALRIAAHLLEASAADLELADGVISVRGAGDRRVSLREVARAAYAGRKRLPAGLEPGLEATRFYDPFFGTASNASHLAVVEVDGETGEVRILRYVVADALGVEVTELPITPARVRALLRNRRQPG